MVRRVLIISLLLAATALGQIKKMLPKYEGRYYIIHTDLTDDDLKEAELRMSRMAEEYHERTKGFAGDIRSKLPFYLYRNEQDYYAAGGTRDSAGFFDPSNNTLNAI